MPVPLEAGEDRKWVVPQSLRSQACLRLDFDPVRPSLGF